ncbi:DinB family protein [Aequorivita viscosa]|nr:DinB family protein [Aequorivita viscosa]
MKRSEIAPSDYNSYYQKYIDLVPDAPLTQALQQGLLETESFFKDLPSEKWDYRYQNNKWTPKDILQHIIDTERVFTYRALYFARIDAASLEGFDENIFAENAMANSKSPELLLQEYTVFRKASVVLFKSFSDAQFKRNGMANNSPMSVVAAGFIICGHEIHHRNIIIERYL